MRLGIPPWFHTIHYKKGRNTRLYSTLQNVGRLRPNRSLVRMPHTSHRERWCPRQSCKNLGQPNSRRGYIWPRLSDLSDTEPSSELFFPARIVATQMPARQANRPPQPVLTAAEHGGSCCYRLVLTPKVRPFWLL